MPGAAGDIAAETPGGTRAAQDEDDTQVRT